MPQRSFVGDGLGDSRRSIVAFVSISAAFPSEDDQLGHPTAQYEDGPSVAGEETLREVAGRRIAERCSAKSLSQER
jgi:hypothetical protein